MEKIIDLTLNFKGVIISCLLIFLLPPPPVLRNLLLIIQSSALVPVLQKARPDSYLSVRLPCRTFPENLISFLLENYFTRSCTFMVGDF